MSSNNNCLKEINLIHFDGKSISLNNVCMSHTIFKKTKFYKQQFIVI